MKTARLLLHFIPFHTETHKTAAAQKHLSDFPWYHEALKLNTSLPRLKPGEDNQISSGWVDFTTKRWN